MIKVNRIPVTPTIFPDKTSQVWKLPFDTINMSMEYSYFIKWDFQCEAEFMHLAQLVQLLRSEDHYRPIKLYLSYLPYARQDKEISNSTTFALTTFISLLNSLNIDEIVIFDTHNFEAVNRMRESIIENRSPAREIAAAIEATAVNTILFPDAGAYDRYADIVNKIGDYHSVIAHKVRNQLTGEIEKIELSASVCTTDKVLIVDDICDGGATFIKLMPFIKQAKEVSLYVSHGIFSKGVQVLKDAGVSRIFTKDGEVK